MYYKNKNVVFLHIPKTGGTSVEHLLKQNYGEEGYGRHYSLRIFEIKNKELNKCLVFTIVRNPFERIASTFKHFLIATGSERDGFKYSGRFLRLGRVPAQPVVGAPGFSRYVQNIKKYFNKELSIESFKAIDDDGKKVLDIQHIQKFDWWIKLNDDSLYKDYKFLKFESLNLDWEIFKSNLNIKEPLPHLNKQHVWADMLCPLYYMDYYDKESFEIIKEIYSKEIEMFEYASEYERYARI